ncbi:MAG TPA: hypothetical protein VKU40_13190 [Thermoanaerobaculia bacterium]|nr:hypothetical protein [Thermoanaerobaculia bacterium]
MNTTAYELLLQVHVAFGILSLLAFWLQMPTRKRGRLHRWVGRFYFAAMTGVVASAVPMTALLAVDGNWPATLLLTFLSAITVAAGVGAWMAARWRSGRMTAQRRFATAANWGIVAVSLTMLAAFQVGGALFVGLGAFGLWAAIADLRRPTDALVWRSWQVRHVEGVIGTGMAVHIAFLAFGLRRLLGDAYGNLHFLLAFVVPVVLGVWASHAFTRRWREKEDGEPAGRVEPAGSASP